MLEKNGMERHVDEVICTARRNTVMHSPEEPHPVLQFLLRLASSIHHLPASPPLDPALARLLHDCYGPCNSQCMCKTICFARNHNQSLISALR